MSAKAVDQCIIKNPAYWPAPTGVPPAEPNKPSPGAGKESPPPENPVKDTTAQKEEAKKEEAKPVVSSQPKKKA